MRAADGAGECCKRELEGEGCDPGAGPLAGEGQHIPEGLERAALAVCCLGSREGWIDYGGLAASGAAYGRYVVLANVEACSSLKD